MTNSLKTDELLGYMNWTDQPAMDCQISHLRQFGYLPDRPLTKGEAAHLISEFEQNPEAVRGSVTDRGVHATAQDEARALRAAVEAAKRDVAEGKGEPAGQAERELGLALAKRQLFWLNTCCDPAQMQSPSLRVFDLYRTYGCRFVAPTAEQVQEILDALDAAMPCWDRDYPQLFYEALELNFPELRRSPGA